MSAVGLMFVGAVLFVNGLLFLGRIDGKGAATFNLFVGALQVAIPFYLIATAPTAERHPARLRDLPVRVHLPVRGDQQPGRASRSSGSAGTRPGWRSWPPPSASPTSSSSIDPTIGLLWLQWSVLWALFWLVLAMGVTRLTALAGWLTLILSFTTCTIPGFLLLLGEWGHVRHVAGAGRHRGDRGRRGADRQSGACASLRRCRTRPSRGRGPGLGVLTCLALPVRQTGQGRLVLG